MLRISIKQFLFILNLLVILGIIILYKYRSYPTILRKEQIKRHVFIDLGANIGDSVHYFIDEDSQKEGLKGYAARDPSTKWEIHIIEANPFFNKKLDETKNYCEKLGHKVYLYKETAAWIKNEKLTFYLDTVNPRVNYWSSSIVNSHPDIKRSNNTKVTVDAIDISELLSKYNSNDEIIMKVDIEGTEYKLLKHLINEGTLKLVDIIAAEFHDRNFILDELPFKELENFFITYFLMFDIKFIKWF